MMLDRVDQMRRKREALAYALGVIEQFNARLMAKAQVFACREK